MNIKDVCKDCVPPKRSPRCHGVCKNYLDAKGELEEKKARAYEQKMRDRDFNDFRHEGLEKAMKHRRDVK